MGKIFDKNHIVGSPGEYLELTLSIHDSEINKSIDRRTEENSTSVKSQENKSNFDEVYFKETMKLDNGFFFLKSNNGTGSCFRLYFPFQNNY